MWLPQGRGALGRGGPPNSPPKGLRPHTRPQRRHSNAGAKGKGGRVKGDTRVVGAVPLQPAPMWRGPDRVFLHKISKISKNPSFHSNEPGKAGAGAGAVLVCPVSPPLPLSAHPGRRSPRAPPQVGACAIAPPEPFFPRNASAAARPPPGPRGPEGKMAAPMSEGIPALEPGAAPYGNFPNYSRFHPPEERVSLLPGELLQSLFPAAARPLLGLDVGCNSGVRGRLGGSGWGRPRGSRVGGSWGEGKRWDVGLGCGEDWKWGDTDLISGALWERLRESTGLGFGEAVRKAGGRHGSGGQWGTLGRHLSGVLGDHPACGKDWG